MIWNMSRLFRKGWARKNFRRDLNGSTPPFSRGTPSSEGFSKCIAPSRFLARWISVSIKPGRKELGLFPDTDERLLLFLDLQGDPASAWVSFLRWRWTHSMLKKTEGNKKGPLNSGPWKLAFTHKFSGGNDGCLGDHTLDLNRRDRYEYNLTVEDRLDQKAKEVCTHIDPLLTQM